MSESKKNPLIAYFRDSFEELKKVTWPTRNQAIRLTFIVIGFCIVFSLFVGVLDFAFNTGYRQLVDLSQKVNPVTATTDQVVTGEPTSKTDLSKIQVQPTVDANSNVKITPAPAPAPAAAATPAPAPTPSPTPKK